MYQQDSEKPLPKSDEVLYCTEQTTEEEVNFKPLNIYIIQEYNCVHKTYKRKLDFSYTLVCLSLYVITFSNKSSSLGTYFSF